MLRDRTYYATLLRLAVPIIAQNSISSLLNVIDVGMLGQLGETTVASVGLANQVFFLLILFLFGTNSGVGVFTSQLWGKGDLPNVRRVQGIGLLIGITGSLIFSGLALLAPQTVLRFYSEDPAVIELGASYLQIIGWSYTITAVTFAYSSVLRTTGNVRVPMVVSIFALSLKTILNFGLILGNFGLPELGAQGAAISTLVARTVECAMLLTIVYSRKLPPAAKIYELFGFNREFVGRVLRTSLPVLANEMLWSFGITTYNMVYGRIGTDAVAAVNIVSTIENLAIVIIIGITEATGIMVGNRIGANEDGKAYAYARQTLILVTLGSVVLGMVLLLSSNFILRFYNLTPVAAATARNILRVVGLLFWIRASNMALIVGVLRAGGDTRFSMFLDAGSVWVVGVPMAIVAGLVLRLPVHIVYLMIMAEEAVKYAVALWRFSTRRWIHNLVRAEPQEALVS
jgi:putative MATE family efflux protein